MQYRSRTTIPAAKLINLTAKTIQVYDCRSGDVITIPPEVRVLPPQPSSGDISSATYYVLDRKTANSLDAAGRLLDDIAIICHKSPGRDNSLIAILIWGGNQRTGIELYRTLHNLST